MKNTSTEPVLSLDELDEKKREFRYCIIRVITGLICLGLAGLIATTLFYYNPTDPWSFSALSNHITNPLGRFGAEVSGHLEHYLRAGSWLVVITFLIWGVRGIMRIAVGAVPLRILSGVATVLSGSSLISMLGRSISIDRSLWGGFWGVKISRSLFHSFSHLTGPTSGVIITGFTTLIFFVISFSLTFGFKFSEWKTFLTYCMKGSSYGFKGFSFALLQFFKLFKRAPKPTKIISTEETSSSEEQPTYTAKSSLSFGSKEAIVPNATETIPQQPKGSLLTRLNPFLKKNETSTVSNPSKSSGSKLQKRVEPTISSFSKSEESSEASLPPQENLFSNLNTKESLTDEEGKVATEPTISIKQAPIIEDKTPQERFLERYRHDWKFPSPALLDPPKVAENAQSEDDLKEMAEKLNVSLKDYQIRGEVQSAHAGPVVTLYEVQLERGEKKSRLLNAAVDISRDLEIDGEIRIIDLDGKSTLGVEVPNTHRQMIQFSGLLASKAWKDTKGTLPMILGVDIMGEPAIADLASMPHLLVAGATGAGKSVAINTMLTSLLYRLKPEECRLILIDPKIVELAVYHDLPHLLTPVLNDPNKVLGALTWAENEMNRRYDALKQHSVRNIAGYNQSINDIKKGIKSSTRKVQNGFDQTGRPLTEEIALPLEKLPYIVIVIDEWADIYLQEGVGKKIEVSVNRLAAKARAAGIHIILATQRPSTDVLSGTIRNNFPARIAFRVSSNHDSRTIISTVGAENLLGKGDMLFKESAFKMPRLQGAFLSDMEVERVAQFLRDQRPPFYDPEVQAQIEATDEQGDGDRKPASVIKSEEDDEIYGKCLEIISQSNSISTSSLQRQLRLGYNRAANMIDRLEQEGYIGRPNGSKPRDVIKRPNSEAF